MRILALIVSLQLGCLFATTFSEYGNLIRNESSLEKRWLSPRKLSLLSKDSSPEKCS